MSWRLPVEPDPSPAELIAARPGLCMHAMDGLLLDDVPLNAIVDALGTPTWVMSAATLRQRYHTLDAGLRDAGLGADIHYAVKANDHLAVLAVLAGAGAGADVVSEGELRRALKAGMPASRIVFSGVGKTERELRLALGQDIRQINVESAEELTMLSGLAQTMGRTARVALRINPDVDALTHEKISTGRAHDKFGIAYGDAAALYARAASLPGIEPVGLAVHIGSQILSLAPFRAAFGRIAGLVHELRAAGHVLHIIDCGGGLGVPYRNEPAPTPAGLAAVIAEALGTLGLRVVIEPGRWLAGPAGMLLASVVGVKRTIETRFVVLDAAMNDLLRPAMYDAWHALVPLAATDLVAPIAPVDVVGPICESADTFARQRNLPVTIAPGSRLAILDAGAYGSVMSSTYNARPLAAAAITDRGRWEAIRDRQPVEALWRDESVPEWLA